MKVIITGATGWVGGQVLAQALRRAEITHIILLQRRPLSIDLSTATTTVETIVHADFTTYPESLLAQLTGTTAILWALGGRHDKFPDLETAREVNVTYLQSFCKQVLPRLTSNDTTVNGQLSSPLRFVLCGGALPEPDPAARLWFLAETRKLKGAAEVIIFEAEAAARSLEAYTVRPAVIMADKPSWLEWVHGLVAPSVRVGELAVVMVEIGVNGGGKDGMRAWEVGTIKAKGREVLGEA